MWRLTAPCVTPRSFAAADMLPSRAVVSKARSALRGRRSEGMRESLVGVLVSENHTSARVELRYHAAGPRCKRLPRIEEPDGVEMPSSGTFTVRRCNGPARQSVGQALNRMLEAGRSPDRCDLRIDPRRIAMLLSNRKPA